jgi:N-acetyl-gamma-glutamyl-phosphate/LysW-gamma-L-alpha-aminoadipyl-6-phosphate reductase
MTSVSVLGGSGYVGGELLRILLTHPSCELQIITSTRYAGRPIFRLHPNLRGVTDQRFRELDVEAVAAKSEIVFSSLPHGQSVNVVPQFLERGIRIIDLAADFRLRNPSDYTEYYGFEHKRPDLLENAVYGLPELHRPSIKHGKLVATPGCIATSAILGLAPIVARGLVDTDKIVIDSKIGSSGAGVSPTIASHHSERSGGVRPYKVTGHRHIAEIEQELSRVSKQEIKVAFTPHAVNMVRGILTTIHAFTQQDLVDRDVWKTYRAYYQDEPFIRIVSDKKGLYGLPNPKVTVGTNYCDLGFELDQHVQRIAIFSALDNLTKGAAGQAVQCFNIMTGNDERTGLNTLALHPL